MQDEPNREHGRLHLQVPEGRHRRRPWVGCRRGAGGGIGGVRVSNVVALAALALLDVLALGIAALALGIVALALVYADGVPCAHGLEGCELQRQVLPLVFDRQRLRVRRCMVRVSCFSLGPQLQLEL